MNAEHDHALDRETDNPARFFGAHVHAFEEGDDHYHTSADGRDDDGTSPHDQHVPGDRCSPCGYGFRCDCGGTHNERCGAIRGGNCGCSMQGRAHARWCARPR